MNHVFKANRELQAKPKARFKLDVSTGRVLSLEYEVVDVGERGADALQQQVEGLDGHHVLLAGILPTRAQRQAQMEL